MPSKTLTPSDPSYPQHLNYLQHALSLACQSPPKPTNFRVGAILVNYSPQNIALVLSTGYTLELPGNTHAEQCAFSKYASQQNISEKEQEEGTKNIADTFPEEGETVLYTTMEPCNLRLSGNLPCVQRIVKTRRKGSDGTWKGGIEKVYVGVKEPEKFVGENSGQRVLEEYEIEVINVTGLEEECTRVATEGHGMEAGE